MSISFFLYIIIIIIIIFLSWSSLIQLLSF